MWLKSKDSFDYIDISNLQVTNYDFENALTSVQPSALREGFSMVTDVKWDDIGALCDVRNELQWSILVRKNSKIFLMWIRKNRRICYKKCDKKWTKSANLGKNIKSLPYTTVQVL